MILNSTTRSILPQKKNFDAHKYIFLHLVNLSAIQSQKCLKIKFKRIIKSGQVFCAKVSSTGNHNIDLPVLSTTHIWRILHIMWTIVEGLGRYFTRILCYECSVAPLFFFQHVISLSYMTPRSGGNVMNFKPIIQQFQGWFAPTCRHWRQNKLPHLSCEMSSLSDIFSSKQIQHVPLKWYTVDIDARVLCPGVFGVLVSGFTSLVRWFLLTGEDTLWSSSSADINSGVLATSGE